MNQRHPASGSFARQFWLSASLYALLLFCLSSTQAAELIAIQGVEPTPLFPRAEPGQPLRQRALIYLENPDPPLAARANLTLSVPTELWFELQPANQAKRFYGVVPWHLLAPDPLEQGPATILPGRAMNGPLLSKCLLINDLWFSLLEMVSSGLRGLIIMSCWAEGGVVRGPRTQRPIPPIPPRTAKNQLNYSSHFPRPVWPRKCSLEATVITGS